jgi:hypothetical protein
MTRVFGVDRIDPPALTSDMDEDRLTITRVLSLRDEFVPKLPELRLVQANLDGLVHYATPVPSGGHVRLCLILVMPLPWPISWTTWSNRARTTDVPANPHTQDSISLTAVCTVSPAAPPGPLAFR